MSAVIQSRSSDYRYAADSDDRTIFTDIYQEQNNIAIWRRDLPLNLQNYIAEFLAKGRTLQASINVTAENAQASIDELLGDTQASNPLSADIAELVDMYCYLFDLKQVGLRLTTLDRAMCPRFHVDKVPCRLVTSYLGQATEWLSHQDVDRTKLGAGNNGLSDEQSGIYQHPSDIQQLTTGDVALIKGERWEGNEGAGLVHRSPALSNGERRLLLTLDFMS
ncbi:MAG: DUF1826 domain-containing protein [Gammaproteobacteria bacterium]|nr:DUF1826 domain-containing protein [Gammaproteobacteria bacterium]